MYLIGQLNMQQYLTRITWGAHLNLHMDRIFHTTARAFE